MHQWGLILGIGIPKLSLKNVFGYSDYKYLFIFIQPNIRKMRQIGSGPTGVGVPIRENIMCVIIGGC